MTNKLHCKTYRIKVFRPEKHKLSFSAKQRLTQSINRFRFKTLLILEKNYSELAEGTRVS